MCVQTFIVYGSPYKHNTTANWLIRPIRGTHDDVTGRKLRQKSNFVFVFFLHVKTHSKHFKHLANINRGRVWPYEVENYSFQQFTNLYQVNKTGAMRTACIFSHSRLHLRKRWDVRSLTGPRCNRSEHQGSALLLTTQNKFLPLYECNENTLGPHYYLNKCIKL